MFRRVWRLLRMALILGALAFVLAFASCRSQAQDDGGLAYKGPVEISVKPGEVLSGTDITYVGVSNDMAEFTIDDMQALKKAGDSLNWEGDPVPSTHLQLGLRLLLVGEDAVHTGGTVSLQIAEPTVAQGSAKVTETKFVVPVTYGLKPGEAIPGTLITYEGRDAEKGAELGIDGYPYRNSGDSIVWEGQLNDQVWLSLDLRVLYFSDSSLRVGGFATLYLDK